MILTTTKLRDETLKAICSMVIVMLLCSVGEAGESRPSVFSPKRDGTYQAEYDYYRFNADFFATELCSAPILNFSRMPFFWYSFNRSIWSQEDMNMFSRYNPRIQGLVDSEEYWTTLEKCLGGNLLAMDILTSQLFAADFAGRTAALLTGMGALRVANAGLGAMLSRISFFSKPSLLAKAIRIALVSAPGWGLLTLQKIKEKYRTRKAMRQFRSELENSRKEIDDPLLRAMAERIEENKTFILENNLSAEQRIELEQQNSELKSIIEEYNNLQSNH